MLTKRQKQIFDFIVDYTTKKGFAPSLEEMRKYFKLKSISTIHQHIESIESKGYLQKEKNQRRSIKFIEPEEMVKIPLLGMISAGQPIERMVERETIAIRQKQLPLFGKVYALRVSGNSMIEENIRDNDIVLIKQQNTAENGQKIIALIDNSETTLKKFYKEKNYIRLQPANKKFNPIIIDKKTKFDIQGVVIDIIKDKNYCPDIQINLNQETKRISKKYLPNKIYNEDCIEVMKNIDTESINLIFADPPYNLSKSNFKMKFAKTGGKDLNTNKGGWDKFTKEEYEDFTRKWLTEAFRILKKDGAIWVAGTYHNIYLTGYLMDKIGFEIINEILWHKTDATPNLSCTRFVADHENFLWARKNKKNLFNYKEMKEINGGKQMRSIWPKGKTAGGKRVHPTQKPEWLLERVILATSNEKDLIFDPFIGSGTTAIVAKKLKRQYMGTELDKEYYKLAKSRIQKI